MGHKFINIFHSYIMLLFVLSISLLTGKLLSLYACVDNKHKWYLIMKYHMYWKTHIYLFDL